MEQKLILYKYIKSILFLIVSYFLWVLLLRKELVSRFGSSEQAEVRELVRYSEGMFTMKSEQNENLMIDHKSYLAVCNVFPQCTEVVVSYKHSLP